MTRMSASCCNIWDIFLTSQPELIPSYLVCLYGISDHRSVHSYIKVQSTKPFCSGKGVKQHDKGNYEEINRALSDYFSVFLTNIDSRDVDENWKLLEM